MKAVQHHLVSACAGADVVVPADTAAAAAYGGGSGCDARQQGQL